MPANAIAGLAGAVVRRAWHLLLAAAALVPAGCGTFLNMQETAWRPFWPEDGTPTRRVYGGVAYDAAFGANMLASSFQPGAEFFGPLGFNWGWSVLTVDLPLSAVGDTITLPWTVAASAPRVFATGAADSHALVARSADSTPASRP
jgi:hypothetical protein